MTMIQALINEPMYCFRADKITLKYLIPGNFFMSAYSFHGAVEKNIKRKKLIFTLDEYEQVISSAVLHCMVVRPG